MGIKQCKTLYNLLCMKYIFLWQTPTYIYIYIFYGKQQPNKRRNLYFEINSLLIFHFMCQPESNGCAVSYILFSSITTHYI